MSHIIDRRLNSKNKGAVNRRRFLDRYSKHVKKAVKEAVNKRSITDMERGEEVHIPADDISEPVFGHGRGGRRGIIHPGNKEFKAGDRMMRPTGSGGGGGDGEASDSGEGEDDFVFQITQEEFLDYVFDDLELPNLTKRHLKGSDSFKREHAGYVSDGNPSKLSVIRSLKQSKLRRRALSGKTKKLLEGAHKALEEASDPDQIKEIEEEIARLEKRLKRVPYLDTTDLRYNLHVMKPEPTSRAVMFCLMDVSGSMMQETKEIAKRFYLLLYMFLKRNYERTEIVFIRHHTVASEVDEQEFFYSKETGGTVVSSALGLMRDIISDRYPPDQWNIYGAQASDGDNWHGDSPKCVKILEDALLPQVQHFSYIEITEKGHQALWNEYTKLAATHPGSFARARIEKVADIFPVFRDLFQKRESNG